MSQLKILVSGDVDGHFKQLFSRVASVHKKAGPFEMLLCVGNFFGDDNSEWEEYHGNHSIVPIPTYVLGPCDEKHEHLFPDSDGCELCPNVTFLGKKGVLTGSSGLKIAYLSGLDGINCKDEKKSYFSASDIESLRQRLVEHSIESGVDILLTSSWPRGVTKFAGQPAAVDVDSTGSEWVAKLAYMLAPRYHFCGLEGVYYERLPYRNHQVLLEATKQPTRFIALAKVSNPKKEKWLYAFSIVPMTFMSQSELVKQPPDVTECPFKFLKQELQPITEPVQQYFYDMSSHPEREPKRRKKHHHEQQERPPKKIHSTDSCWFCLGNAEVEKHMVISVADSTYLALAKGGLTPDHLLILPIGHHQSTVELEQEVLIEIEKFKDALKKFYKSQNKTVVFYERNYKSSHLQIQVVPLPSVVSSSVKEVFLDYAADQSIDLEEIPQFTDLKQVIPPGAPYFFAELASGEKLFCRVKKGFPLQFGREVLSSQPLLNMPSRADWKSCAMNKEEETQVAEKIRKKFQKYDFTLEDV